MGRVSFPKPQVHRSQEYMAFVRTLPCYICGNPETEAHHSEGGHSMAQKGDDTSCVPLCHVHHAEIHQLGKRSFEEKYDLDLRIVNLYVLREYIKEKGL